MAEEDRAAGDEGKADGGPRFDRAWPAIGAVAVAGLVAVGLFGMPAGPALIGGVVLAGLIAAGHLGRTDDRPNRAPAEASSALWPEPAMRLVLDAIDDPCFLTDDRGLVRYQNRAAVERFGAVRPGDPLSFKLRVPELLAAVERTGRGEATDAVRFTERLPTERFYRGLTRAIRRPRRDGRSPAKADFVLIRLVDETEIERVNRMRGDFIANASHELRTPLASLTGFVETLLGPARKDEANRERFLKIMLDQAQRMSRLIDDLLSLSRIEMKAHLRPEAGVDLSGLVHHVADALDPLAGSLSATIVRPDRGVARMVRGDRDELIQVLSNLVENALKYGGEGVTVTVALTEETGPDRRGGVTLSVADTGPGIDEEHLPRLTERFYRVEDGPGRARKGTGLGLAIVKHIVNRHQGRLTIRSVPGSGTTVLVWLEAFAGASPDRTTAVRDPAG